jgi:hypothetical protein
MRKTSLILASMAALWLHLPSPLFGAKIRLLSSGDASNDAAIQSVLRSAGDSVTIGPTYNNFTGAGVGGFNAVFLSPSLQANSVVNWVPWGAPPDLPTSGQQALINFVNQGGGLVRASGYT